MELTTNDDWTWVGNDYKTAFATTSDPRVVAVIERDDEYGGGHIDGDVYAPAFYFERGRRDAAGSTFMDAASEEIAEAWAAARSYYVNRKYFQPNARQLDPDALTARYMAAFYGTTVAEVGSSISQGTTVTIFNTPTWREHVGITDQQINRFEVNSIAIHPGQGWIKETVEAETEEQARAIHLANYTDEGRRITWVERESLLAGDIHDWQAALDGDVYSAGYATNVARVMDDGDIDITDGEWTVDSYLCCGLLGEDYAKESAGRFDWGTPDLPEMIDDEDDIFGARKRMMEDWDA